MSYLPPNNLSEIEKALQAKSMENMEFSSLTPSVKNHWFSFGECGIEVIERTSAVSERGNLLFLHGRLADGKGWLPLMEQLPWFRCLALDFPGFGRSFSVNKKPLSLMECVDLSVQALDHFTREEDSAILIGQDIGGVIAQLCALRCKEKVKGIVLVNSVPLADDPGMKTGIGGWRLWIRLKSLLKRSSLKNPAVHGIFERIWRTRSVRRSVLSAIGGIADSWPGPFERRFWNKELCQLSCPALLLWGNEDELNPPEKGVELMKVLPESDFFQDNCGHWPQLENPEWVASKIREFAFRKANSRRSA